VVVVACRRSWADRGVAGRPGAGGPDCGSRPGAATARPGPFDARSRIADGVGGKTVREIGQRYLPSLVVANRPMQVSSLSLARRVHLAIWHQSKSIPAVKRVLYEQVTDVNVFPYQGLCFCGCRCGCRCSPPGLYSHSDESDRSGLGAGWGSRGESMLPFIRRPWETKTRTQSSERGVDATNEQDHLQAAC